jgi:hypothetical protein
MFFNVFQPHARLLGVSVDDNFVVDGPVQYFETDNDLWLAYDVAALVSAVFTSEGDRVSAWDYNPATTLRHYLELREAAADGLLAA